MVLVWFTNNPDMATNYSKINLGVALLDCILFWLWGNSIFNIFAWLLFSLDVIRVAIAILLYKGVKERHVFKCKAFCIGEFILLCIEFILLFFKFFSIGYFIWTAIVIILRGYGIWIIGGFVRTLQSELGQTASFPWNYFTEPVQVSNKANATPGLDTQSPI